MGNAFAEILPSRKPRRGFSLVEMMIAIVILGLGLIMVATMFPVAWDRARTLSEHTTEQTMNANARTDLAALLQPASVRKAFLHPGEKYRLEPPPGNSGIPDLVLAGGSFAGDLFYTPVTEPMPFLLQQEMPVAKNQHAPIVLFSDTRVHALNMQNMLAVSAGPDPFVDENPWKIERVVDICTPESPFQHPDSCLGSVEVSLLEGFRDRSFCTPRVRLNQRIHPPMPQMPDPLSPNFNPTELDQWNERLSARRFCSGVLHRLRNYVSTPRPPDCIGQAEDSAYLASKAAAAVGSARTFDIYYVMLRRPQSTNRYARQADDQPDQLPDPDDRGNATFAGARNEVEDVAFPVPWRVHVEFLDGPAGLMTSRLDPDRPKSLGLPTEIEIPPTKIRSPQVTAMYVQMFQVGSRFVDEVNGALYRVTKQRIIGDSDFAVITLDREVLAEDIDDGQVHWTPGSPPQIQLNDDELVRTVWIYPPAVEGRDGTAPIFAGPSPVVDIQVGSLTLTPMN